MSTFFGAVFGQRLKEQREKAGYKTLKDFRDKTNIAIQTMSSYETGVRMPDAEKLALIAWTIGCTADYLLQLEDAPTHDSADICMQTGLSPCAVDVLMQDKAEKDRDDSPGMIDFIDDILVSDELPDISEKYEKWKHIVWMKRGGNELDIDDIKTWRRYDLISSIEGFLSKREAILSKLMLTNDNVRKVEEAMERGEDEIILEASNAKGK